MREILEPINPEQFKTAQPRVDSHAYSGISRANPPIDLGDIIARLQRLTNPQTHLNETSYTKYMEGKTIKFS